jgi:uncharacterized cupin superfamily protein
METGVFWCTAARNRAAAAISNLLEIVEGRVAVDEDWRVLVYSCWE